MATVPMSAVMLASQRLGAMGEQPPERVVEEAVSAAGADCGETQEHAVASVAHLAFGAAAGAMLAELQAHFRFTHGVGPGVVHGLAVYTASYAGWIPALGILPFPTRDSNGRVFTMLGAHVAYGAVLGHLLDEPQTVPRRLAPPVNGKPRRADTLR